MQEEKNEFKNEDEDINLETLSFHGDEVEGAQDSEKAKKKLGMLKKQKIMIIAFAALSLVLTLLYFLVFKPIFDEKKEPEAVEPEPLIAGEVRDQDGVSILMFEHIPKASMQKITVTNQYGTFNCLRVAGSSEEAFYIAEHPQAPVKTETYTQLIVAAGYPVVGRRITDNCENFGKYGLGEADSPACVTVTSTGGATHTFYVGNKLPSGGGYYCRYKDRAALYVIDASVSSSLLVSAESLLSPIIGNGLGSNDALTVDEIIIQKNGEPFVSFKYIGTSTGNEMLQSAYEMVYPAKYVVNDGNITGSLLSGLGSLSGYVVVAAGDGTSEGALYKNDALMAEFGFYDIETPMFELYYKYGETEGIIVFTESGSDEYYFAYSYLYDTVVLIEKAAVPYVEWDMLDYVSDSLFDKYIKDVKSIAITGKLDYKQQIHNVNEKFYYTFDSEGTLHCRAESGYQISGNTVSKNPIQAFYNTTLLMKIRGYAIEENFDLENAEEYAKMVVEMHDGSKTTYEFYRFYGYCYFKVDGAGEFYTTLTQVNKVLVDAVRAANGYTVVPSEEYADLPDIYLNNNN